VNSSNNLESNEGEKKPFLIANFIVSSICDQVGTFFNVTYDINSSSSNCTVYKSKYSLHVW